MRYDVVIAGGGTAGCACAYTAGRLGLRVLVIEKNSFLGGSMTSALVVPAMQTTVLNTEFYDVFYGKLHALGGAITYLGNKGWFNPELAKIVLDELMKEARVDVLFDSEPDTVEEILKSSCDDDENLKDKMLSSYIVSVDNNNLFDKKKMLSSYIETTDTNNTMSGEEELSLSIETKYLVDATGDGKICEKLNCEFLGKKSQPVSLRFVMSGVDVEKFADWIMELDKDRNVTTCSTEGGEIHLSTAYTWDSGKIWALEPIFKQGMKGGVINELDCNYFQIFTIAGAPGSIAFNAPRLINPINPYTEGRSSILRLSEFCKKYLPGFEHSYISSIANSLGIRVSNRVKGRYVYTKDDLLSGKKFARPVVTANYPIDIHSAQKNGSTLEQVTEYQLPIEALTVKDNLFVIGRCISADFEAQAALRIIPSCFSMGEGLAKYLAEIIGNCVDVL